MLKGGEVANNAQHETVEVFLQGWLMAVDCDLRTAELHECEGELIPLRFSQRLDATIQRLTGQFVEVAGLGVEKAGGGWRSVYVNHVTRTQSLWETFDTDELSNKSDKKVFRSEDVVVASEPFDVDQFISVIHEARDGR